MDILNFIEERSVNLCLILFDGATLELEKVPFLKLGDNLVQLMVGFCNIGIVLFPIAFTVTDVALNHPRPTILGGRSHIFGNLSHEPVQLLHDTFLLQLADFLLCI